MPLRMLAHLVIGRTHQKSETKKQVIFIVIRIPIFCHYLKGVSQMALDQSRAPIHQALEQFRRARVVPFDVPGHKRGRGNPELTRFLGEQCVGIDVNSMKPLDNLCQPVSVIREAEELAAEAFGAAAAFLMVGGTTSAVQSMVLTACKQGDKLILPRNVHRSVINALVLNGAQPVYINPETDPRLTAFPWECGCLRWKRPFRSILTPRRYWSTTPPITASAPIWPVLSSWPIKTE